MEKLIKIKGIEIKKTMIVGQEVKLLNDSLIKELAYCYPRYIQFSSVAQSCPTFCNPMNRSKPGLPVHNQLLESTQTHVH